MHRCHPTLRIVLVLSVLLGNLLPAAAAAQPAKAAAPAEVVAQPASAAYEVMLLSGSINPPAGRQSIEINQVQVQARAVQSDGESKIHVLLQLYDIPGDADVQALNDAGIELLEYIPNNTWLAAMPVQTTSSVFAQSSVRWMGAWPAARKLHPEVKAANWSPHAIHPQEDKVMVMVLLHQDVALDRGAALAQVHGGVSMAPIVGVHGMTMWLPEANLPALAAEEEVAWIEEGPAPLEPNNDGARASMQVDSLYTAPYNLTGSGVRLFVYDGGTVLTTHSTFNSGSGSRVTLIDEADVQDHPTHVAGTAAGDGDGTRAQGVAPGASIFSAEYEQIYGTMLFWDNAGDIEADYALARNTYQIDLSNNSIGSNTANNNFDCARQGDYGVSSNLLDGIVRGDNPLVGSPVLMLWANGNERTGGSTVQGRCGSNYLTTAPPSCAKNPIHIGASNSNWDTMTTFSSWGPCDDGRLKPVVVAPGCQLSENGSEANIYSSLGTGDSAYGGMCGTSMATPAAAGVASLMLEAWRGRGYGGANDRPLPALVKAMLMHTARDLGQNGPDYINGYGEIDAKAAVDLIRNGSPLAHSGPSRWGTGLVAHAAANTYSYTVPSGTHELKASLAWDDRAAAAYSAVALVNNLDLELVAPDGVTIYRPWVLNAAAPYESATTATNTLDNQEQVLVSNPTPGVWTVRVVGATVPYGPQTYGLVISSLAQGYNPAVCAEQMTNGGFETDTTGWTLNGATRIAAPAAGHGSYSLRLAGSNGAAHSAYTSIAVPAGSSRAELSFDWFMQTDEATYGHTWDFFRAEVRNTSNVVLSTVDFRSDGWQEAQWMHSENLDLSPYAGQTVRIFFTGQTDSSLLSTFYVDDVHLTTCTAGDTTAPAAVTTLSAASGSTGAVSLSWTAPGDDSASGTAAAYTVRYATSAISSETAWNAATDITGEPAPLAAGAAQNMTVTGLTPGQTYYFAIKTQDEVPNLGALSNSPSAAAGVSTPPLTISGMTLVDSDPTNQASAHWTVTFNMAVSGVSEANFTPVMSGVTGATLSGLVCIGSNCTVTVNTGSGSGTLGLNLSSATNITGPQGQPLSNAPYTGPVYTVDKIAPTVAINKAAGQSDPTNTTPINFTVIFSEPVISFTSSDVELSGTANPSGRTLTEIAPNNGTTFNVAVFGMTGSGTVIASIPANSVFDPPGNLSDAATSTDNNVAYDVTAPNVSINQSAGQADPTNASPIHFTVVFSEAVSDFTETDVALSGTAGATTRVVTQIAPNNGTTYDVAVSGMTASGTVIASVPANSAHDAAGNPSFAASSADNTVTYDGSIPSVTINQAAGQSDPTGASPIHFTVVFSEPVSGFASGDVALGGTAGASTQTITQIAPNNGTTYDVSVGGMTTGGTVIVTIQAGAAQDAAGNGNNASTSTDNTVTYDATDPSVTINQAAGQTDPTSAGPIHFTVVFSEPVSGFANGDVALSGTAGATTATVTDIAPNNGTTYDVTVSGMSTAGTVTAGIAAGAAADTAGNPSAASTSSDNTVTFDPVGLQVSVDQAPGQPDPTNGLPIQFRVVFSRPVADFTAQDVSLSGTANASGVSVAPAAPNDGSAYTVSVSSAAAAGTVIASIPAGAAHDALGAGNTASTSADNTVTYDNQPPSVTIRLGDGQAEQTTEATVRFKLVFSEPVSGLQAVDILLGGTANAQTAAIAEIGPMDGATYEVTVSGMTAFGTIILHLQDGAALDAAGNASQPAVVIANTVEYVSPMKLIFLPIIVE